MNGEKDLQKLLEQMKPTLNFGEYVFVTISNVDEIARTDTLFEFKETEGITVVLERKKADELQLSYQFISSWITLKIHSSLEAVGLTAAFSTALTQHNISCNVVAGFYHDHLFVSKKDTQKAIEVLTTLSKK